MPYFVAILDIMSSDDEFERDMTILEEGIFLNDYFDKHGVFTIEDY